MRFVVERVNVDDQIRATQPGKTPDPAIHWKRPTERGEGMTVARVGDNPWHILQQPVSDPPGPGSWAVNKGGEYLRIPLVPYNIPMTDAEGLVHLGAQVGAAAMALVPRHGKCLRVQCVLGNVYQRTDKPGFQCWLGLAYEMEE